MREPLLLNDATIASSLQVTYGVSAAEIEFLPLGYDNHAAVYRVTAIDGQLYFLKARRNRGDPLTILIPRFLQEQGNLQVVAPLPTLTGELWGQANDCMLLLYPFIEGQSGWTIPLSDDQWVEYGAIVRQIHDTRLSPALHSALPAETFVPHARHRSFIEQVQAEVRRHAYDHPIEQRFAAFWLDHCDEIQAMMSRADFLGRTLQARPPPFVLCHNDIHPGNLLATPSGNLFVVDWDQPLLAPKERDLMLVMNEPGIDRFLQGYGPIELDLWSLAYVYYARLVEDLGEFAELIFFMDVCDDTKQIWTTTCMGLFKAGGWVEAAHKLYDRLPLGEG